MRWRLLAGVLAVGAAVIGTVGILRTTRASAEASGSSQVAASAPSIAQLQEAALRIAADDGEADPSGMEEAESTVGTVAHVIEREGTGPMIADPETGRPWSETQVYAVTMSGHFTYNGPVPPNRPAPTGTSLTVMINARTGALVSETLSDSQPDMHAISSNVTPLGG
jgi:hypothetical protein